jgi:hypothetical protein
VTTTPTTSDLSSWTTLALVDKLAAVNDELIGRGLPARDIAAELGVDSIEELRAFAIADDSARDGRHPMTTTECPTGTESQL